MKALFWEAILLAASVVDFNSSILELIVSKRVAINSSQASLSSESKRFEFFSNICYKAFNVSEVKIDDLPFFTARSGEIWIYRL